LITDDQLSKSQLHHTITNTNYDSVFLAQVPSSVVSITDPALSPAGLSVAAPVPDDGVAFLAAPTDADPPLAVIVISLNSL
jgi:hypothetical protein